MKPYVLCILDIKELVLFDFFLKRDKDEAI